MPNKLLSKKDIRQFLQKLIETAKTVAPARRERDIYDYKVVRCPEEVALDCRIPYYSPKAFIFPPTETLLKFEQGEKCPNVRPVVQTEPLILFGAHPCDVNALWLLDAAFSTDNKDEHYLSRRDQLTIIGLDCKEQCDEYSFCYDMGTHVVKGQYDLFLTDVGDKYYVRVGSEKGAKLVAGLPAATRQADSALKAAEKEKEKHFTRRLQVSCDDLPKLLGESYDSLVWQAIGRKCYSCGSCNLVCPTCYCFNVMDELAVKMTRGERKRTWDSCQLESFAEVAGGENFRKDRSNRLRHRFFRKAKYLKEIFGRPGCVGCGRCDRACTAGISSVTTYNQLKSAAG